MSYTITSRKAIPNAYLYVLSNDKFMSGWGQATGKINTIILPCDSWKEAIIVRNNAKDRTDQTRVRIVANKPKMREGILYSLFTKETAEVWFEKDSFNHHRK